VVEADSQEQPALEALEPQHQHHLPHLPRAASDSQVSTLHLHHEHSQHPRDSGDNKLELPRTPHTLHAKLDTGGVHQVPTHLLVHAEAKENQASLDDGDAGPNSTATASPHCRLRHAGEKRSLRAQRHAASPVFPPSARIAKTPFSGSFPGAHP